ncbi:hypothetical protein Tco_1474580, partial [Tanacetum coccineum]
MSPHVCHARGGRPSTKIHVNMLFELEFVVLLYVFEEVKDGVCLQASSPHGMVLGKHFEGIQVTWARFTEEMEEKDKFQLRDHLSNALVNLAVCSGVAMLQYKYYGALNTIQFLPLPQAINLWASQLFTLTDM